MKRCIFALLSIGSVGMVLADSSANVVRNPGFETVSADGVAENWHKPCPVFSYVKGEGRNGSCALKFSKERGSPHKFPSQIVKVESGKRYYISAWVRTKNVRGRGPGAQLWITCMNDKGETVRGTSDKSKGVFGTVNEWQKISVCTVIPSNAVTCLIAPHISINRTGTVWFDDVSCVPEELPVLGALTSGVYRDMAVQGEAVFSAPVTCPDGMLAERKMKLFFDVPGMDGSIGAHAAKIEEGIARIKVDVSTLPPGKSKMSLRLVDGNGNVVESRSMVFNRVKKMPKRKVYLDADRRFVVDEKPFYPVGVYISKFTEQAYLDISNSPFNCVLCYRRPTMEEMDRFHAAGKKVIYSIKGVYLGLNSCPTEIVDKKTEREWVGNTVRNVKNHPALLAWYLCDELSPVWVETMRERYELMKRLDRNHPTFVVLCHFKHLREYVGTYDILGTDSYPIGVGKPGVTIARVGEMTRETCLSAMGKTVLQVPQIFDWSIQEKKRATGRAPTEAEVKNMVWQCVLAGANGVCAFSYSAMRTMEKKNPFEKHWAEVCRAYEEFARYTPMFLSAEKAPKVSGNPDGVMVRAFRHEGKDWLVALNAGHEPIDFSISVGDREPVQISLPALGVDLRSF